MADEQSDDAALGKQMYRQALAYNWRPPTSSENAAIARALFERAAAQNHLGALRELAEMMFVGAGGPAEPERALGLKWAAFRMGDGDALDELSALLGTYSEALPLERDRNRAALAADKADEAFKLLSWLSGYIDDVSRYSHFGVGQP